MAWFGVAAALAIIAIIFLDAFEAMILPRRVRHSYRLSRNFYRLSWGLWSFLALRFPAGRWRFGFLSIFGPLSLFALIAVWATGLIVGFALLHWSLGSTISHAENASPNFSTYLYFSGTTFFTLGYGDVVPTGGFGRTLSVIESGIGFGFLALVISYLPVLYQAFSRREATISLLDARAGSPPTAGELIRRLAEARSIASIGPILIEWERWAAELLESHLSFPVLRYYRSQHDNQSWLAALTAILDTSAVFIASEDDGHSYQARLTFAMARHAAVDLVLITRSTLGPVANDRLAPPELERLLKLLRESGFANRDDPAITKSLSDLRALYEPFIIALAAQHQFEVPPFLLKKRPVDNWQTSPGMKRSPGLGDLQAARAQDEHYD
jgi:hypothetical protein